MPVLPLLAFVACSRVSFTLPFTFTILHLCSAQIILILTVGTVLLLDAVFALMHVVLLIVSPEIVCSVSLRDITKNNDIVGHFFLRFRCTFHVY